MDRAVVVGASAAGLAAADALREGGWRGAITVVGDETVAPYDRPTLSKRLLRERAGGGAPLRPAQHFTERDIDLRLGTAARGLDIDRHLLVTSDGDALPWDHVVVATGSCPRAMTTSSGAPLPVLRTAADLDRLRGVLAHSGSITLVGAGFIGLEIAAALRSRDVPVTVVGDEDRPLARQFGPQVAGWLWRHHLEHGVKGHLGTPVWQVSGEPGSYRVHLTDGTVVESAAVLAAIGVAPSDGWLAGSGVRRAQGVVCDAAGRTNVPGVWAAGDVARVQDSAGRSYRFDHWTNAIEHGRHVGLNIAGGRAAPYHGTRSLWTEQYGHTIRSIGTRHADDTDVVVEGDLDSGRFVVLHGNGAYLHAVTVCGLDASLRGYRRLLLTASLDTAPLADAHALAASRRS